MKFVIVDKPWDFYLPKMVRESITHFDEDFIVSCPQSQEVRTLAILNILKHYGWIEKEKPSLIEDKGRKQLFFKLILCEELKKIMKEVSKQKDTKVLKSYIEEKDLTDGKLIHLWDATISALIKYSVNPKENINEIMLRVIKEYEVKNNG